MNRSYSKTRHINSTNYLLEQKYLEDKRKSDGGILLEQEEADWVSNLMGTTSDFNANKDYSKFPCVSTLKVAKGTRLRFDKNYYYFPDGRYATIADVNKYTQEYTNNPNVTLNYSGTYSCKETTNEVTGEKKSTIQRSETPKKESASSPESLVGWDKFPCVTSNPNAKKKRTVKYDIDGSVYYEINGFGYYGGGRKMNLSTNEMSDYHCGADGMIKEGPNPAGDETQGSSSTQSNSTSGFGTIYPNVFTPNVVSAIKIKIDSADKNSQTLSQDDINKLYNAINQ